MLKLIGSKPLYMWQTDRQMYVEDDSVKWVDFAHDTDTKALRVEVKEIDEMPVADIPNILLQSANRIRVWMVGEHGNTICGDVLNPLWRNQPADYVYTETEIKSYESLEARIKALEENGGGNVGSDFGGVEITDGEPTKETTVMTLNPNAEEVHLYTAEEIDAMKETWTTLFDTTLEEDVNKVLVTTDMNGNPFKAKKLRLTFLGTVTDARLNMSFGGAMQKTYFYQAFSADKYVRAFIEIGERLNNGICISESKFSAEIKDNVYTLACTRSSAISDRPSTFIESVSLGLQADKYYKAGTRVIVEGVLES